jgi:hypothetical protein
MQIRATIDGAVEKHKLPRPRAGAEEGGKAVDRPPSRLWDFIRATSRGLCNGPQSSHELASAPIGHDLRHKPQSARGLSRK